VLQPDGSYAPINLNKTYVVTIDDYMQGGDDYFMFENSTVLKPSGETLENIVIQYLMNNSVISPKVEGRITRVFDTPTDWFQTR